ncbi:hypothetical protein [Ramlibacter rhizophilus]|uniref:Transmembrane protein n=1 Tax=Ramlibacter rhizophilus TaxID=1781167 RepID=A0A4Z0BBL6_9BURK|nr:hypothetical protein [Ramlibacter rhizophilus]TFY96536.1 hypothetical protein EZ242_21175 [Ramlibacter rhizophilus]
MADHDASVWSRLLMAVAWPAFLAACLLELVVFALVDPLELSWAGGPLGWSRQAVYTAAFFAFWTVCALSSGVALWLARGSVLRPLATAE